MSSEYPDVLGDLVEARRRFQVHAVHYVMALQPDYVAPGETLSLHAWLQSCWEVPVQVNVSIHLPSQPPGGFSLIQKRTEVPLQAAEVGELVIPIASSAGLPPGQYDIGVTITAKPESQGLYVRSEKTADHLGETLLTFTKGTALATTMGLGFEARTRTEQTLSLQVEGGAQPAVEPDLTPSFISRWVVADLPLLGKARQHVNDQRLYLTPQLKREILFKAFLEESQERFRDANLALHIGEALFLAKILTYTTEYFLKQPDRQDVVLIPAYHLAYRHNLPTDEPIFLIARADYARMTRLAISLSFGLLRRQIKRDIWSVDEQIAVADLVAERVEHGGPLPAEFLYLPLLLGGLMIAREVQMPGETLSQSLALLAQARKKRADTLAEIPELAALLDRLLQLAQAAA
jgi:hypothetical protein